MAREKVVQPDLTRNKGTTNKMQSVNGWMMQGMLGQTGQMKRGEGNGGDGRKEKRGEGKGHNRVSNGLDSMAVLGERKEGRWMKGEGGEGRRSNGKAGKGRRMLARRGGNS